MKKMFKATRDMWEIFSRFTPVRRHGLPRSERDDDHGQNEFGFDLVEEVNLFDSLLNEAKQMQIHKLREFVDKVRKLGQRGEVTPRERQRLGEAILQESRVSLDLDEDDPLMDAIIEMSF